MIVKKILTVFELLLIFVFVLSVGYIGFYMYQSYSAKSEYAKIRENVLDSKSSEYAYNGVLYEYSKLYEENKELSGWLKVEGTSIDYPVVRTGDNDYYMHRDFYKSYKYCGIPFMDCQCKIKPQSDNIIIYAHNMRDGSMFGELDKYDEKSFFDEFGTIEFDTLYKKGKYRVISAFYTTPDAFSYYTYIDMDRVEFDNFIKTVKSKSLYNTDFDAQYGDKLLTLSTCSYNKRNERFVVVAKQVE
ncbi:MAG: class B sortase [Clostridia bacterium]|nr:class B sortase [Clostridia bacterium]